MRPWPYGNGTDVISTDLDDAIKEAVPAGTGRRLVVVEAVEHRQSVLAVWRALCARCRHSYYVSPGWIENWLACVAGRVRPLLVLALDGGTPLAAFLATSSRRLRGGLIPSRIVNVFATGDYDMDRIAPIYNAFLMPDGATVSLRGLLEALPMAWDEVFFPGLSPHGFPGTALTGRKEKWLLHDYDKPLYFIEMDSFGTDRDAYLSRLSPNTRSQIRRSLRLFSQNGPVRLQAAATVEEASAMAHQLYRLCNARKASKHLRSSIDDFFVAFHDRLIRTRFPHGEIQLLHVYNDSGSIGYLYNHVADGTVYNYQSGFEYSEDNRLKPGLVTHVEAILYNAGLGHRVYDFGAGDDRYKKSLATGEGVMPWVRVLRPELKMGLFRCLKGLLERLRSILSRPVHLPPGDGPEA